MAIRTETRAARQPESLARPRRARPATRRSANLIVRPFQRLEPRPADRERDQEALGTDLGYLQILTADDDTRVARALVEHTLRRLNSRFAPPLTVVNRRLRAARLWLNAVLAGDVSPRTLGHLTDSWLPTLTGTDEDRPVDKAAGRDAIEFLRGTLSASIFADPWPSLLRHARALYALETVLSAHLAALEEG